MSDTSLAPGRFSVVLDGRPYVADLEGFQQRTTEKVRAQGDTASEYGEASLNPQDLWRRSQTTWVGGSGQSFYDKRETDDRRQYESSFAINPWVDGKLQLSAGLSFYDQLSPAITRMLHVGGDVVIVYQNGADWQVDSVTGDNLGEEVLSGQWPAEDLWPSDTIYPESTSTSLTGSYTQVGAVVVDATTDGSRAYVLDDTNGVVQVNVSAGTSSIVSTQTGDIVGWAKGRLFVGNGFALHNVENATTTTQITPVSHLNPAWRWTAFGEGDAHIYAAGFAGTGGGIYRIGITEEGTSLSAPVKAAELPLGEIPYALLGYVGAFFIGTSQGIRFAQQNPDGSLAYGDALEVGGAVKHLTPFGDYVWFSVDTGSSTAIGRINLATFPFPAPLQPAWALDLWNFDSARSEIGGVHASEHIVDLITNSTGDPIFVVANHDGVDPDDTWLYFSATGTHASTGTITSSRITYDMSDRKSFEYLVFSLEPMPAGSSIDVEVLVDEVAFTVGTLTDACGCSEELALLAASIPEGESLQYRLTLNAGTAGTSPVITRVTVRALPVTRAGRLIQLPLLLHERVVDGHGREYHYKPWDELSSLRALESSATLIDLEMFREILTVVVDGIQWGPELRFTDDGLSLQGTATLLLRTFPTEAQH